MIKSYKTYLVFAVLVALASVGPHFIIGSTELVQDAIVAQITSLAVDTEKADPQKIENKIFGYSTKGKPIEGYVIGSGTNTVLLFGSIHGNEMGSTELLNKLIETIKADPSIISEKKKVIIIPMANPDGYYDRTDKLNANRVNLNINFETADWKKYNSEGYYAGPEPFSEVESRVLKKVVEDYYPSAMIAFHARGAFVAPESGQDSMALAKWYAKKTGYDYYNEWNYFGTATRWFTDTKGHPSITVELTTYLKSDWEINKYALLDLVSSDTLFSQ